MSEIDYKSAYEMVLDANKTIYKENKRLNNIINGLDNTIENLNKVVENKDNIIKEVREYMNKHEIEAVYLDCKLYETEVYKDILEILDKVGSENNGS